jgi:uncharacterized protein (TIGR03067 family)
MTDEMALFQGTWEQTAEETGAGRTASDELGVGARVTFEGDTFVVTRPDGAVAIRGTFRLGPNHEPKAVDWMDTFGEDAGKTFLAIYEFDGETMRFCAADAGQERPKSFSPGPGEVLRVHKWVDTDWNTNTLLPRCGDPHPVFPVDH